MQSSSMTHEDRIRVQHMLDAVSEALAFTVDKHRGTPFIIWEPLPILKPKDS